MQLQDWTDIADISDKQRMFWNTEIVLRAKYLEYYEGTIFETAKIPAEQGSGEEQVQLYPVGVNLCKMICLAQADSQFGEWEEDIVRFDPRKDVKIEQPERDASIIAQKILSSSSAEKLLWEIALDREIYGGGVVKIIPDRMSMGRIRWERVPLQAFFPIWDPENIDRLLEVYLIYDITKEQAYAKYGYKSNDDLVKRVEHWTPRTYENKIDGKKMDKYSGVNPFNIVPFVYFPRLRSNSWYGDSLIEDIMAVQDELNLRVADVGEQINYDSHPIRYGLNLPKSFSAENYPVGPGIFWDLGRKIGDSPEPKVGVLETTKEPGSGTHSYINFLYDFARVSTFSPPIVFGEDEGGGQRSGVTLEIRMLPLVRATRRSRAYMSSSIRQAMSISAQILAWKSYGDLSVKALKCLINGELTPTFAPILPRDQAAIVDEVVKRLSTTPPSISLTTALKRFGESLTEEDKIDEMIEKYELDKKEPEPLPGTDSATGVAPKENLEEI